MTPKRLRLDDQLCFALYAATNAVTRAYRPRLEQIGLTYPQYLVLLVLWQDGDSTLGAIARRLGLGANAVTPLVDRLDHAGLLTRARDDEDRRLVHVALTAKGRALEADTALTQHAVECETQLEPEALAALREELMALVRRMEPDRFAPQEERDETEAKGGQARQARRGEQ